MTQCATCDRELTADTGRAFIRIVGQVCRQCGEILRRPTIHVGCVMGASIAEVCRKTDDEFERRRAKLIDDARGECIRCVLPCDAGTTA